MPHGVRSSVLVFLACSLGCAPAPRDAALIRVEAVEQSMDRPSELLLRGDGFPQGMRGEARLRGALYPAAEPARAIDLSLPCRAIGARAARVELGPASERLQAEGPFEGLLELRFGTRADAQLLGRLDHALFRLGEVQAIDRQFALSQAAQRYQRALGIAALEESEQGLSVTELAPDSPATRAGLAPRDRILRMDGRPVQLVRDLVQRESSAEVVLELRRAQEGATRVVRIAAGGNEQTPEPMLLALAALLGLMAGLVVVHALPAHALWAPRRREYWLLLCSAVCTLCLASLIVRDVDPLLARMCEMALLGVLCALLGVCLHRRINPTLRTGKDPNLAPLL